MRPFTGGFAGIGLRLVVTTPEVLYPDERRFLEDAFQAPVANEYGAAEAGLFAFDCPMQKMHMFEEAVLMEADTGSRVVVSELFNYQMPLINYENGDMVRFSAEPCSCGRTSRVIDEVMGRTADLIRTADGRGVSAYLIYYAVKELDDMGFTDSIRKYRVVQRSLDLLFYVVRGPSYSGRVEAYLRDRLKGALGDIQVDFISVQEIPREKSGKLRFFAREP